MPRAIAILEVLRYKLAVAQLRHAGDPLKLAHAVRHLGDAWRRAGQPADAELCFVEALSICRRDAHASPLDVANALRSFAVLEDDERHAEAAQRLWQEARDLHVACGVQAGVAESAARLALLARAAGDGPLYRARLAEAQAAADAARDPETLAYVREVSERLGEA